MRAGKENGILLPSTSGTASQVLTSNGNGTLSWSSPLTLSASNGDVLYNNAGVISGATYLNVTNGFLEVTTGLPNASSTGAVAIGAKDIAGRIMPAWVGPLGLDSTVQAFLGRNRIGLASPVANSTTLNTTGLAAITATGTATARTIATTNLATSLPRIGYVGTSNLSGSIGGWRTGVAQYWRGNVVGAGGFTYCCTFVISNASAQANGRAFVGLTANTSAPTNVEPTTLVNTIGMTRLNSNTTWGIYGANGTATGAEVINLGTNFPANTINTDVYRLTLFCPPNASTIGWRVDRVNAIDSTTGQPYTASGVISATANLPVSTTFMVSSGWVSTGTLTGTAGIDIVNLYIENDT